MDLFVLRLSKGTSMLHVILYQYLEVSIKMRVLNAFVCPGLRLRVIDTGYEFACVVVAPVE